MPIRLATRPARKLLQILAAESANCRIVGCLSISLWITSSCWSVWRRASRLPTSLSGFLGLNSLSTMIDVPILG